MRISFPSFLFLLLITLFSACGHEPLEELPKAQQDPLQLIHLSHFRMNDNKVFNEALTKVDYSTFDIRLLGGDLAVQTSAEKEVLDSLDQIFDLSNAQTMWSLGNHDYQNLSLVESYTKRPRFYTHTVGPLTFVVLDTQDSLSSFVGEQLQLIQNVTDTISQSTHLIFLHHKLIWMYGNEELETEIASTSNGRFGDCFWCINPNNFYEAVYPLVTEVESRGVEVFFIAGDLGYFTKAFHYQSPEGIDFLGSGMDLEADDNQVLLLEYDFGSASLSWNFSLLTDL